MELAESSEERCALFDRADESVIVGDMPDVPIFDYPIKEAVKVGKTLSGEMPWDPKRLDEYVHVFRVAYVWRNSHAYPMRKLNMNLAGRFGALEMGLPLGV